MSPGPVKDNPYVEEKPYWLDPVYADAIAIVHREVRSDTSRYYDSILLPASLINRYYHLLKLIHEQYKDTLTLGQVHYWESQHPDYFNYAAVIIPPLRYGEYDQQFTTDDKAEKILNRYNFSPANYYRDTYVSNLRYMLYANAASAANHDALNRLLKNSGSKDTVIVPGALPAENPDLWSIHFENGKWVIAFTQWAKSGNTGEKNIVSACTRTFLVQNDSVAYGGYRQAFAYASQSRSEN